MCLRGGSLFTAVLCSSDMQADCWTAAWQKYSRKHIPGVSLPPPTHTSVFHARLQLIGFTLFRLLAACPATAKPRESRAAYNAHHRQHDQPCFKPLLACLLVSLQHRLPVCCIHSTLQQTIFRHGTTSTTTKRKRDSTHLLSAHALLLPLPPLLLLSLPKPSHIPLHLLGHCSR
jgi:hypothetical protein